MSSKARVNIMRSFFALLVLLTFAVTASAKKPVKKSTKKKAAKVVSKEQPAPVGRKSLICSQGREPAAGSCPNLEGAIKNTMGMDVECWSKLFYMEGNCNVSELNDPIKMRHPHLGFGMCGAELSPAIRHRNRRGIACERLKDIASQMRCCASLMLYTSGRYFNTVGCGNVPRCKSK